MPTRFYLPSTGAAAVSPAYDAAWEDTSIAARLATSTSKISSASLAVSFSDAVDTDRDILFRQYVSVAIAAQTIAAQTVKFQIRGAEGNIDKNMFSAIGLRVVSNDGGTVRGTLLAVTRDDLELLVDSFPFDETPAWENRQFSATTTAVTSLDNDRIIIEIGTGGDPALDEDHRSGVRIGDASGTDLPEDNTTTTDNNAWVEFANVISFEIVTPGALISAAPDIIILDYVVAY